MTEQILLTVAQVAEALAVGRTEAYALVAQGKLERRYIGKTRYRVTAASVRAYAESLPTDPAEVAS